MSVSAGAQSSWFVPFAESEAAACRLYCFPHAGGGTQAFRGWQPYLPPSIAVVGVCLPGRERRFRETPLRHWPEALEAIVEALADQAGQGPFALFGHSLGARLAYEAAHRLAARRETSPLAVIVAGCHAPAVPRRWPTMHQMSRAELVDCLRRMGGVPAEVLDDARMMNLLAPVLLADLELAETWRPTRDPLPCPLLALCGRADQVALEGDMAPWHQQTRDTFEFHSFPGGHFFPQDRQAEVVATLGTALLEKLSAPRAPQAQTGSPA